MDIISRKYKFIEAFMKIKNVEKIEQFEELLRDEIANDNDIVANTIDGQLITRKQYIKNNEDAVAAFEKGEFKSQSELQKKYSRN
jgi:hypothetical protein